MITASGGAERQCLENGNQRVATDGTAGPATEIFAVPALEQGEQLRQPQSKVCFPWLSGRSRLFSIFSDLEYKEL